MENNESLFSVLSSEVDIEALFLEEDTEAQLDVAASLGTLSTLGTFTGCASTFGTVSCWG